jgi:DNA-binding transcriptional LysR family regulator
MQEELKRGDLVAAVDREMESRERYYLAFPPERADYAPLAAFRDWIVSEAGSDPDT